VPERKSITNTTTLTAISATVTYGVVPSDLAVYTFCLPLLVHSGQWKPTDAVRMQSGQMGRSQRWHRTPARRLPWR
jgi:hypothetical protein